jgi:hypothetical protein
MWSGRFYVIAVDYDRYVIFKHCTTESNKRKSAPLHILHERQFELYKALRTHPKG